MSRIYGGVSAYRDRYTLRVPARPLHSIIVRERSVDATG